MDARYSSSAIFPFFFWISVMIQVTPEDAIAIVLSVRLRLLSWWKALVGGMGLLTRGLYGRLEVVNVFKFGLRSGLRDDAFVEIWGYPAIGNESP
jgi:hypothetical protein